MNHYQYDVFISHASEDKAAIVKPLFDALGRSGIIAWLDQVEIKWGNSITERINDGLNTSRFFLVIATPAFISKNWPVAELKSMLSQDIAANSNRILVLMAGDETLEKAFFGKFPLLKDKRFIRWNGQPEEIVAQLSEILLRQPIKAVPNENKLGSFDIPMPKIRRPASDREKSQFLKNSFETIRAYFKEGLSQLKERHPEVETDLDEVDRYKFLSTVYWNGEQKCQCKVWLGNGGLTQNSILFSNNRRGVDIRNDNSINESLSIDDSTDGLALRGIMGMYMVASSGGSNKNSFTAEDAAKYLWSQFIQSLSQQY